MLEAQLAAGSEFGDYRIEGDVGRGGMGVVLRARDLRLDRPVALKVIAPELAEDSSFRERFEREAHLAAAIDHPNVIPVYAAGEIEGLLFLAMRLVEGVDLRQLIAREGHLDAERAVAILNQVAGALDAAHHGGLVHRDVKPGNVLLDLRDGREHAYLTDFGLTKDAGEKDGLTKTGTFVGTTAYLAPEQIEGRPLDARADVYALGCVLFESITGRLPFDKETEVANLYAHINETPPQPSLLVPGLDAAFDAVIEQALAKEPSKRFQSAGDLGRAAVAAAAGKPLSSPAAAAAPPPAAPAEPLPAEPTRAAGSPPPLPEVVPSRRWSRRQLPSFDSPTRIGRLPGATLPRIPIDERFAYLHEPLREDGPIPLLGNEEIIQALTDRVAHSSGGSFLVTGFRGVGKTTIVDRVIDGVREALAPTNLFAVKLNVARPRTTSELLYEIVRRLYDEVESSGLASALDSRLQERLAVAYRRTSRSFTETRSDGVERGRGFGLSVPLTPLGGTSARFDMSRTANESLASESSDLPYSDAEVEQDFEQIIRLFQSERPAPPPRRRRGFGRRTHDARPESPKCQLLVVVDELDKLTLHEGGLESIEELLAGLKNLLTMRGAHFLFVAGPDLYERAISERQRGNSVYDAVFGWQVYVPCVWKAEDKLLHALIADDDVRGGEEAVALRDHLAFWGRGLPRQLVGAVQELVRWEAGKPYLALEGVDLDRMRASATLERIMRDFIDPRAGDQQGGIELDKWRVGVYYALEWILRFEVTFTAGDVVELAANASIDPLLGLNQPEVEELLGYLAHRGVVRQVSGRLADHTFYGDEPAAQLRAYEVSDNVEQLLSAGGLFAAMPEHAQPRPKSGLSPFKAALDSEMAGGRYVLLNELDRAGTGRVYRARDSQDGSEVAIKVFDLPNLADSAAMRARFEREAQVAASLSHSNIVRTHTTFRESDGRLAIVMELIQGQSLRERLQDSGILAPEAVVVMAFGVLDALDYLHSKGIARLDMRPSSIMLADDYTPKVVNLGLAKPVLEPPSKVDTGAGAVVGTPAYAAPEQLEGRPADIRADLFALALIMYECLCGRPARPGSSVIEVMAAALTGAIDLDRLEISPQFQAVIRHATEWNPSDRFAGPTEMRAALTETPEAGVVA